MTAALLQNYVPVWYLLATMRATDSPRRKTADFLTQPPPNSSKNICWEKMTPPQEAGENPHRPYVPENVKMREFTLRAVLLDW